MTCPLSGSWIGRQPWFRELLQLEMWIRITRWPYTLDSWGLAQWNGICRYRTRLEHKKSVSYQFDMDLVRNCVKPLVDQDVCCTVLLVDFAPVVFDSTKLDRFPLSVSIPIGTYTGDGAY